jgi:SSS family solute:Na+ symporter
VLHLLLLALYAALLTGLGWWVGRRATAGDFFVAGRRLSAPLLAASLLAANIGAGSTVGAAGLGYRDGLGAWWWVGSAGLGALVLALTVGPRIWDVAARWDLRTLGDFLERRFGPHVRGLMAALLWMGSLAILAAQLIAVATVLEAVAGVPRAWGTVFGGLFTLAYFTTGGLLSTASVNMVQLVVLVTGLVAAVPFAWQAASTAAGHVAGGAGAGAIVGWQASAVPADYWHWWQSGRSGIVYLPLLAPSFIVSPGLLQKVYGARDGRAVRAGVLINGIVLLAFALVPPLLGMLARALHPDLPHHELALPTLLRQDLPVWLGALGLAALVSAEVSTADAILFMLSTSLARDLYRGHLRPDASEGDQLRVVRAAAVLSGVLGIAVAIWASSIVDTMKIFYSVLSAGLFVPVVAGLYLGRAGQPEALAAMGGGVAVTLAIDVLAGPAGLAGVAPVLWGLTASAVALMLVLGVRVARPVT